MDLGIPHPPFPSIGRDAKTWPSNLRLLGRETNEGSQAYGCGCQNHCIKGLYSSFPLGGLGVVVAPRYGCGSNPMVPFWGGFRATPILEPILLVGLVDVHWGRDLDFDPWPYPHLL